MTTLSATLKRLGELAMKMTGKTWSMTWNDEGAFTIRADSNFAVICQRANWAHNSDESLANAAAICAIANQRAVLVEAARRIEVYRDCIANESMGVYGFRFIVADDDTIQLERRDGSTIMNPSGYPAKFYCQLDALDYLIDNNLLEPNSDAI